MSRAFDSCKQTDQLQPWKTQLSSLDQMGPYLLNMRKMSSLRPSYTADTKSSRSLRPSTAQWVLQEGLVCKCVRKRGQGERTPISQLIEYRY